MQLVSFKKTFLFGTTAAVAFFTASCDTVSEPISRLESANALSEASSNTYDAPGAVASIIPKVKLSEKNPQAFGIGAVLPLQGKNASLGQSLRHGLELAVAEVNATGGVHGQLIQLDVLDSQDESSTGAWALNTLRSRGESIILVGDNSVAIAQATQLADFPQLIGFLTDYVAVPRQTPKNGVRIYLNGDQEGRAIQGYLAAAGVDHVSIIHTNDLLGESHKQYLLYLISDNHAVTTSDEGYGQSEQSFDLLARTMRRADNGGLILAGSGAEYPRILEAFDSASWKGLVLGYAGQTGLNAVSGQGSLAATAAYPLPDFAANPRATDAGRAFADSYHKQYGEDPGLPAAYAYDTIHVLASAASQSASGEPLQIRAAFIALRGYVGAVGHYDIKSDGDTEMPLRLFRSNGQPAPVINNPAPTLASPNLSDLKSIPLTPSNQP